MHPPSEIKSNFKFKTLRWRPLRWRLTLSELLSLGKNGLTSLFKEVRAFKGVGGWGSEIGRDENVFREAPSGNA